MITMHFKGEEDLYRSLVRIEGKVKRGADELTAAGAEGLMNYMRSHWSASRQAVGSGNPPAKDTENLDSSIRMEESGRDALGRFASRENTSVRFVRINTAEGSDPQGRGNYAQALEDPEYYNLPFIAPAVEYMQHVYSEMAKRYMRL